MLKKIKYKVYTVFKESGERSLVNDFVEYFICAMVILNAFFVIIESVDEIVEMYGTFIYVSKIFFFVFFLTEYLLRFWIADMSLHKTNAPIRARIQYVFSLKSIINVLALAYFFIGANVIDFRIFRILRVFRITQIGFLQEYTDTILEVIRLKKGLLLSSVLGVLIFMLISSVVIYDLEYKAQPQIFSNILECLWWSMSTVTTVGYGDMYPITGLGKAFGSFVSLSGLFIMAVPIGILTNGFFVATKLQIDQGESKKSEALDNLGNDNHRPNI